MSDSNDSKPTGTGTPVPDLIEQYRARREAWIAQADELARLRDDVRESAEREAMEIVTTARRDVRQIVMEARRELLVLSAQVQAALGESGVPPDPAGLLTRAREVDGREVLASDLVVDAVFAPEEAVKGMLDEARADMDKLVEDARTVPFQALAKPPAMMPPPEPPARVVETRVVETPVAPPRPHPTPAPSVPLSTSSVMAKPEEDATAASRVLLSSSFPSDAVPVQSSGRSPLYLGLVAVVGLAVAIGAIWWLRGRDAAPAAEIATQPTIPAPTESAAPAETPAASSAPATTPPVPETVTAGSGPLSLLVEARRSSWLRTTVDGQTDAGRMLAQGETVRLSAKESVSLRVGDAGAVFVSVNNGQPAPLGSDGVVVTRQFTAANPARTATAAPVVVPPSQAAAPQPPQAAPVPRTPAPASPIVSSAPGTPPQGVIPAPVVQPVPAPVVATPPLEAAAPPATPPPPARAETPPAPVARPEATAPAAAATPSAAVVAASRQWLEAYHRQDRAAMAQLSSDGLQLADERRNEERFPPNVDVSRTLDRVSVQIAADTAVLTAVMTERSPDTGAPPRVSPISQVWELRGNQWRVRQVRLVSEARLNQIFR